MHKVCIVLRDGNVGSIITLDGQELRGVTAISLEATHDKTHVSLTLHADVEIVADVKPDMLELIRQSAAS